MADAILMVVPEFTASIVAGFMLSSDEPLTINSELFSLISIPKFLHASIVASVSAERRTFLIVLTPFARDAKKSHDVYSSYL